MTLRSALSRVMRTSLLFLATLYSEGGCDGSKAFPPDDEFTTKLVSYVSSAKQFELLGGPEKDKFPPATGRTAPMKIMEWKRMAAGQQFQANHAGISSLYGGRTAASGNRNVGILAQMISNVQNAGVTNPTPAPPVPATPHSGSNTLTCRGLIEVLTGIDPTCIF